MVSPMVSTHPCIVPYQSLDQKAGTKITLYNSYLNTYDIPQFVNYSFCSCVVYLLVLPAKSLQLLMETKTLLDVRLVLYLLILTCNSACHENRMKAIAHDRSIDLLSEGRWILLEALCKENAAPRCALVA